MIQDQGPVLAVVEDVLVLPKLAQLLPIDVGVDRVVDDELQLRARHDWRRRLRHGTEGTTLVPV